MKKTSRLMVLVVTLSVFVSANLVNATAYTDTTSLLNEVGAVAEQYGFEIDYTQPNGLVVTIASYETVDDFVNALESGDFELPCVNDSFLEPIAANNLADTTHTYLGGNMYALAAATSSGNRRLAELIPGVVSLCATISYRYEMINSQKYYTAFTNFATFFSGLNPGFDFDLTTWTGTVCSSINLGVTPITYTPATSGRYYYIQWGGSLQWSVEIAGVQVGMSDYVSDWFIGMGDFSNMN
jgi:hypothetical protein